MGLASTSLVPAIERITLAVDDVDGGSWQARGIVMELEIGTGDAVAVAATIGRLVLPEPVGTISNVSLRCPALLSTPGELRCRRMQVQAAGSLFPRAFTADARYTTASREVVVKSADAPIAGRRWNLETHWDPQGWRVQADASAVEAAALYSLLAPLVGTLPELEIASGDVSIDLDAAAIGDRMRVDAALQVDGLAASNADGTLATDDAGLQLRLTLEPARGQQSRYALALDARDGEAYLEPAYFDLAKRPLHIEARGVVAGAAGSLTLAPLDYDHRDTLRASATATLELHNKLAIREATIDVAMAQLPGLYQSYLQGFLIGTPLAKLQTRGSASGRFVIRDERLQGADLSLEGVNVDDAEQRVAVYGVDGDLHWRRTGAAPETRLDFDGGFVYRVGFGAGEMRLAVAPGSVELRETLRVPVLDGALVVDTFAARRLRSQRPEFDFDARLEPVDLRRLTAAFGWPAFPGTLAGELPMLTLREGVVRLGGSLVVRAFDGSARVSNLRIDEPFGRRRGAADIEIDNVDLAQLTEVFSLGRIEGRLDGRIAGLRTLRSQPTAFDARFYTPPDDRSRHRISRRALSNISEISGGPSVLASGFLSFFEQFSYAKLGIRCVLRHDVCEMSGVEPAERGYYIVKGKGLPRIDVIGHAREVNWPQLVSQIAEALKSQDDSDPPAEETPK